jgi:hypothetical protein
MAIINNVEIWFAKLDPSRPNKKLHPENPTWEIQIRTKSKEQKKELEENFITMKPVREDPKDDESKILYYRGNVKRKMFKLVNVNGKSVPSEEKNAPVDVVDGKNRPIDPGSIGNGSIANIRVFQYDYVYEGKKGKACALMAVQLIKHVVYVPKPIEEFGETETETVVPEDDDAAPGGANGARDDGDF